MAYGKRYPWAPWQYPYYASSLSKSVLLEHIAHTCFHSQGARYKLSVSGFAREEQQEAPQGGCTTFPHAWGAGGRVCFIG